MIDKITPRPHEKVQAMLAEDGFEDNNTIITCLLYTSVCQARLGGSYREYGAPEERG